MKGLYTRERLSAREISRLDGASCSGVLNALDRFGISRDVNGHARAGPLPFGFDYLKHELVKNSAEQVAIRLMRECRAGGMSLREIAGNLNLRCLLPSILLERTAARRRKGPIKMCGFGIVLAIPASSLSARSAAESSFTIDRVSFKALLDSTDGVAFGCRRVVAIIISFSGELPSTVPVRRFLVPSPEPREIRLVALWLLALALTL